MSTLKSVVLVAVASALAIPPAAAMSGYRWKYRAIVVIAGSGGEVALAEQRRIFAASLSGLDERDVVIVWVTGDTVSSELGPGPGMSARATSHAVRRARKGVPRCPRRQGWRHEAPPLRSTPRGRAVRHHRRHAHAPRRNAPQPLKRTVGQRM